ncbi:hypothetical protein ACFWCB_28180 [Streptomyces sp. NPDC060048]|uniref:hypothetical protein n=1 Tax=unclassified Streptomyces TaxID=2593676 RepID=UPI0036AC5D84
MSQPLMTMPSVFTDMFPVSCRSSAMRGPVVRASGNPQAPGEAEVQTGAAGVGAPLVGGGVAEGEAAEAEGLGEPGADGSADGSGEGGGLLSPGHCGALSGQEPAEDSLTPVRSAW